jgi:hypothetical protein
VPDRALRKHLRLVSRLKGYRANLPSWSATLIVTPAGWNTRSTRRVKRSRDVLSLAPFRLLAFAGATLIVTSEGWNIRSTRRVLHPRFTNARFVYLYNPYATRRVFAVESLFKTAERFQHTNTRPGFPGRH